jgi:hypothetical protein
MNRPERLEPGIFIRPFGRERTLERPIAGLAGRHEADVHVLVRRGANLFRVQSGIYLTDISQNLESHVVLPLHISVQPAFTWVPPDADLWTAGRIARSYPTEAALVPK